jgi:PAS domain S-box-containing protein
MKDEEKTKEKLLNDLTALRQRVAELEASDTERVRAEEALRESERRYGLIADNTTDYISILTFRGIYTYLSPSHKLLGYPPEELLGKSGLQMIHPDDRKRLIPLLTRYAGLRIRDLLRLKTEGLSERIYFRFPDRSGQWHDIEATANLVEALDGKGVHILLISRDITERMRAEEALRESEEKYRNLVERASDGICIIQETIIRYANPCLAQMWGGPVEEITDVPFTYYIHPDELPRVVDRYQRRMAGEDISPIYETVLRRKDGSTLYAELNAGLITYQGKPANLVIVRDISDRKRAEEELRQSYARLQKALEGTIHALMAAVEMKDPYTAGHQRRVAQLACAIANEIGLSQARIEGLRMAGLIHDVGKISVPAEILSKPGRLTELEFSMIGAHSRTGYDILNGTIDFPWPVAEIVLQHHERMDGRSKDPGGSGRCGGDGLSPTVPPGARIG